MLLRSTEFLQIHTSEGNNEQLLVCYITEIFFLLILLPAAMPITSSQFFHSLLGELYGRYAQILKRLNNLWEQS